MYVRLCHIVIVKILRKWAKIKTAFMRTVKQKHDIVQVYFLAGVAKVATLFHSKHQVQIQLTRFTFPMLGALDQTKCPWQMVKTLIEFGNQTNHRKQTHTPRHLSKDASSCLLFIAVEMCFNRSVLWVYVKLHDSKHPYEYCRLFHKTPQAGT